MDVGLILDTLIDSPKVLCFLKRGSSRCALRGDLLSIPLEITVTLTVSACAHIYRELWLRDLLRNFTLLSIRRSRDFHK